MADAFIGSRFWGKVKKLKPNADPDGLRVIGGKTLRKSAGIGVDPSTAKAMVCSTTNIAGPWPIGLLMSC